MYITDKQSLLTLQPNTVPFGLELRNLLSIRQEKIHRQVKMSHEAEHRTEAKETASTWGCPPLFQKEYFTLIYVKLDKVRKYLNCTYYRISNLIVNNGKAPYKVN